METEPRLLFVGPSGVAEHAVAARAAGFVLRTPARRGDIDRATQERVGVIVLADGRFQQCLSVGHAELCAAIDRGWLVWGLSSLGAIRAYEMRELGMRGFGTVYEHFLGDEDFQDDEVALLHLPDPPYIPVSEPLIHLRHFLAELEGSGVVSHEDAHEVIDALKAQWFGRRTVPATLGLLRSIAGPAAQAHAAERATEFGRYRIKSRDLTDFLSTRAWAGEDYRPSPKPAPYTRTPRQEGEGGSRACCPSAPTLRPEARMPAAEALRS